MAVLRRLLDALVDCVVVSFAFWTLLYCLGLATQWSLWPSSWLWLAATLGLLVWQLAGVWRDRDGDTGTAAPGRAARRRSATGPREVRRLKRAAARGSS